MGAPFLMAAAWICLLQTQTLIMHSPTCAQSVLRAPAARCAFMLHLKQSLDVVGAYCTSCSAMCWAHLRPTTFEPASFCGRWVGHRVRGAVLIMFYWPSLWLRVTNHTCVSHAHCSLLLTCVTDSMQLLIYLSLCCKLLSHPHVLGAAILCCVRIHARWWW